MSDKKLFLLDAMALIYRAHFAFIKNPVVNSKGLNTSAVLGFVNSLLDILNKQHPTHIGVAFDMHGPTFRHEEFPEYKANRDEVPEDIITAIPLVKRLLKSLSIPVLEKQGFEADDIIGTLSIKAEKDGFEVYMVTPDKDFAQLVTDKVFLYKPARMGNAVDILNPAMVEEKMGIPPNKVIDFLGLKGDKVDNIPGIPKVGDKTAVELIKQFGTVEKIVEQADEITKNSIRLSVQENGEQGLLSKRLATIHTGVPVDWNEDDLKVGSPDKDAVIELMNELEFRTTAKRVLSSPVFGKPGEMQTDLFGNVVAYQGAAGSAQMEFDYQTIEDRKHSYHLLETEEAIADLAKKIKKAGEFTFDTETTSLDPMLAELVAMTITIKVGEAFMIYFEEGEKDVKGKLGPIIDLLASNDIVKVGQNLKYDMLVLKNYGIEVTAPFFDTMLADYLVQPDKSHSMDNMARQYLNYQPVSITKLIGKKGKGQLSMRSVKMEDLLEYACEDSDITCELKEILEPKLKEQEVTEVFEKVEIPLMPVLTEMEFYGVKIDEQQLVEYSKDLQSEINNLEQKIYDLAGVKFNINSPKQLGEVIFIKLELAKGKKTKTGQYSTNEAVLTQLAMDHEMPAIVIRYRQLSKLKSTYVDALPALINPKTGRVHTTYSQAIAATGRLSSNHPNLQNIPIRTEEGRQIRKAFVPQSDEFTILSADYSQVELRLMAHFSEDPGMSEAFINKLDIHKATAAKVFGVELDEVTSEMRGKAKMVNFGIIYGISAFGLSQRLRISRTESKEIIDAYFEKYAGIKKYMDESIASAREHGYAKTILGRKRFLPDINSQNATLRGFAERNAINTPVQGSAADLIKVAMINIQEAMKQKPFKSKMIMQVHDELVFEAHQSEVDELMALVTDKMENALPLKVPMMVEAGTGKNWLEAH